MEIHVAKLKGRCIIYYRHPKKKTLIRIYPVTGACTPEEAKEYIAKMRATHGNTYSESQRSEDS